MKQYLKDYLVLALIAGLIVALDQWTKAWIRSNMVVGEIWNPVEWLEPYARIVHWHNTGVAFGMFQGMGQIFTILAFLVAVAIIYFYPQVPSSDWTLRLAMGMQLGGAVGNLVDRIAFGRVTDFISVGTFPVFNIADASITTGICILILGIWIQERGKKDLAATEPLPIADNGTPPVG